MSIPPPRFDSLETVSFVSRPNRFLVRCRRESGRIVEVFMPNPGRMRELLLPNVTLTITPSPSKTRKTKFTAIAVLRDGAPVFLHTHLNNQVAHHLLANGRVPSLEDATVLGSEVTVGHSRFDFEIEQQGQRRYVEVKSVTLFGRGVALFPDAITERGRRHIEELAALGSRTRKHVILFLVHTPTVHTFLPDYHTDIEFSRALYRLRKQLDVIALSVSWTRGLRLRKEVRRLDIPWPAIKRVLVERGASITLLVDESKSRRKFYLQVEDWDGDRAASARKTKRRAEQRGLRVLDSMPVRSPRPIASAIREALGAIYREACIPLFSEESSKEIVYVSEHDPRDTFAFQELLESFRMETWRAGGRSG